MNWQEIIKEVCEHKNWTHFELSKQAGLSRGYVSHLARGLHKHPSMEKAMQILKYHPDTWTVGGGEIKRVSGDKE